MIAMSVPEVLLGFMGRWWDRVWIFAYRVVGEILKNGAKQVMSHRLTRFLNLLSAVRTSNP